MTLAVLLARHGQQLPRGGTTFEGVRQPAPVLDAPGPVLLLQHGRLGGGDSGVRGYPGRRL
jgi:hypothetical protein